MLKKVGLPKQPLIILNMEYRRKSPGEALLLPDKAAEIQIKGHIALFPWPKGGADFTSTKISNTKIQWQIKKCAFFHKAGLNAQLVV